MWITLTGTLNATFIILSLWGIWMQLQKVWQRKTSKDPNQPATSLLSLNQFSVSFFAYWSFFVYGYSITPFNHFIVWPRLIAAALVLALLFEIAKDRKSVASKRVLRFACAMMLVGVIGLFVGHQFVDQGRLISQALIVTITLLLAQGYAHQIKLIIDSGSTGAVSIRMSQFILAMDVTTILFATALGMESGWPLMLLASVSATTKLVIMYLFYWVRMSPLAALKRDV